MGNLGEYLYLRLVISGEFWHLRKSARHGESFWNMYEYVVFLWTIFGANVRNDKTQ